MNNQVVPLGKGVKGTILLKPFTATILYID
jgi:hypothetical protein